MTSRDVQINVTARQTAAAELDKVTKSAGRLESQLGRIGKSTAGIEQAASWARTVFAINAVRGGMAGINAIVETFRGENQNALALIERMPFGVGALAKEWRSLLEPLMGVTERLEKINAIKQQTLRMSVELRQATIAEANAQKSLQSERVAGALLGAESPVEKASIIRSEKLRQAQQEFDTASVDRSGPRLETARQLREQKMSNADAEFFAVVRADQKRLADEDLERRKELGKFLLEQNEKDMRMFTMPGGVSERDVEPAADRVQFFPNIATRPAPLESRRLTGSAMPSTDKAITDTAKESKKTNQLLERILRKPGLSPANF
jgi:hypothetical protein